MKISVFDSIASTDGTVTEIVASAQRVLSDGFDGFWMPQIFGYETLNVLAIVGREVPGLPIGTAVVPTYPRHPVTMAASALTTHAASLGNLTLGIGLSHKMVIENIFGMDFSRPALHMSEYLTVLNALLNNETVAFNGETMRVSASMTIPNTDTTPDVVVAALGPKMLNIAGTMSNGTVTWMTGPKTLGSHIVPTITDAAARADRDSPRVVCCLPVCVTNDEQRERARVASVFEIYGFLPSYRDMLDREGVEGPQDVAIVGTADQVTEQISALGDLGVTEFVGVQYSTDQNDFEATRATLKSLHDAQ